MSDSVEKQFAENFVEAWNETAEKFVGVPSAVSLLSLREVTDDQVAGALAVAATWSSSFTVACDRAFGGALVCLFKSEDCDRLEQSVGAPTDGAPQPGVRALLGDVLAKTAKRLAVEPADELIFGEAGFMDLTADSTRLAAIVGEQVWVTTLSLAQGEAETQVLLLYAPHGSLEVLTMIPPAPGDDDHHQPAAGAALPGAAAAARAANARAAAAAAIARREEPGPRNIERLLDVELDVVVRFGVTNVPLRDVVRMGVGTMIELNRAVDEPVELLVNGRSLARGEVVVVDGYYGVRITEIGSSAERALTLM